MKLIDNPRVFTFFGLGITPILTFLVILPVSRTSLTIQSSGSSSTSVNQIRHLTSVSVFLRVECHTFHVKKHFLAAVA